MNRKSTLSQEIENLFIAGTTKSGLVGGAEKNGGSALAHVAKRSHFRARQDFSFLLPPPKRHRFRFSERQTKEGEREVESFYGSSGYYCTNLCAVKGRLVFCLQPLFHFHLWNCFFWVVLVHLNFFFLGTKHLNFQLMLQHHIMEIWNGTFFFFLRKNCQTSFICLVEYKHKSLNLNAVVFHPNC